MIKLRSPQDWIRPQIHALSAYHVPPAGGMIKLDAMENPYRWPDDMVKQWLAVMREAELNRYPDPAATRLLPVLREVMDVPADSAMLLGNGSDEVIQMILMAMADPRHVVLAPTPSFVMYQMIASFVGMPFVGVPLHADFSLNRSAMLAAITAQQPAVIFLAYPNNPTGNLFDSQTLHEIIQAAPGVVVVDEAYHAFAAASFMRELPKYPNLLVMRTVSKMGLAGLRLGLLAGGNAWLQEFDKVRLPYNINVLTQASAQFALQHHDVLNKQTVQICRDRDIVLAELRGMAGLQVFPSKANFILFRTPVGQAQRIFAALKDRKVLIKNLSGAGGLLSDCLRVTVGTPAENAIFIRELRQILSH
jgi:histidinol-phosphate aminotransferase